MPFLVTHKPSREIVATLDRDDIPAWLSLVEIPPKFATDYRSERIPPVTTLPRRKAMQTSPDAGPMDRPTPLPATRTR